MINNYICPYNTFSNKFIKLLTNNKINNILKIRELLYTIMSKNYDLKIICLNILKQILNSKSDNKKEIIELYTKFDNKNNSFKNIIHIEALLINITKLYNI